MKATIDIRLSRSQIERLLKVLDSDPISSFVTIGCSIDISEIKFCDSYTELVSGTEICSTSAVVRCE